MRVRYLFLGMLFLFTAVILSSPGYAAIDIETAVGIWLLDSNEGGVAKDASGNGQDGGIVGDVKLVEGKFNKALEFGATENDAVMIPHNDSLSLVTYSLLAWIKIPGVNGFWQCIIAKEGWPERNYGTWSYIDSGIIHHSFNDEAGNNVVSESTSDLNDGEWHHIAATYDKQATRLYVDGVLEGEAATDSTPAVNGFAVTIGGGPENDPGSHQLTGAIDDAAIFSVGLSGDDIVEIMDNGLAAALNLTAVEASDKLSVTWGEIKGE